MIRRAEGLFLGIRQGIEGVSDDCHRKPAALLKFEGVVDTPRRAGSSIPQTGHDEVRLGSELVKIFLRRALLCRELAPRDHVGDAVFFL